MVHPAKLGVYPFLIILQGIVRTKVQNGEGTINQKDAMIIDHIKRIKFPDIITGVRDKAMLLIGFAGGFRKSEIARIQISGYQENRFRYQHRVTIF